MVAQRLLILVLAAAVAGCELFGTRDPEPPSRGRGSWEIPVQPGDVLVNLSSALFERSAVNYLLSFDANRFVFEADPEALQQDPSLADWGYAEESNHLSRLLSEGTLPEDSLLSVVFIATEETIVGDSAEVITDYELQAQVALTGAPGPMAGRAHFFLRVGDEGYWVIYRWRDQRSEDRNTWSDLKSLVR